MKEVVLKILKNVEVSPKVFRMSLKGQDLPEYIAGQFLNLDCGKEDGILLRRPFGLFNFCREQEAFDIMYAVHGKGTEWLSKRTAGELAATVFIGNGFSSDLIHKYSSVRPAKRVAIVGGGLGCVPLCSVVESGGFEFYSYLGFRSKQNVLLQDEFKKYSSALTIATEDGTFGQKGYVTDVFLNELQKVKPDIILLCGPEPMIKAFKSLEINVPTLVSVEQRMACGVGACYVCVCATTLGNKRVCVDGPVFDLRALV